MKDKNDHEDTAHPVCPLCGRACRDLKTLERHIERLHPDAECARCGALDTLRHHCPKGKTEATGAKAVWRLERKTFLDNKPNDAVPFDTPAGYIAWRFPDGTIQSGPIGSGDFGEKACNPDPPKFCGERSEFLDWWRKMGIKLRSDTVCFPTAQQQVDFIYLRLGGAAAKQYDGLRPDDPGTFFHELERLFGNPHAQEAARRSFDDLGKSRQWLKYKVMPFGLVNAQAKFQDMMNTILRPRCDQGVVVYLDNILIYTMTVEEHRKLVRQVFPILQREGLAVVAHKSFFHVREVEFLGYIINANGVEMSSRKVEAVLSWEMPKNLKDIQRFLGCANF
jgi:hypothetical protein